VATPEFIAATIVRGRAGTPMPAFGRDSAAYARLAAADVLDVTAYVRERLGPASASSPAGLVSSQPDGGPAGSRHPEGGR
jgi:mono/diheme cytochrome c family protein